MRLVSFSFICRCDQRQLGLCLSKIADKDGPTLFRSAIDTISGEVVTGRVERAAEIG
jgi:hypothetical protein